MTSTERPPTLIGIASGVLAVSLLSPPGLTGQTAGSPPPQGISPGSAVAAERAGETCPTFSWSAVDRAAGYELVLYRVGDDGGLTTAREQRFPAGASSWTPPAAQCPEPGARHAWAVRALSGKGAGEWSEALLFETPGAPSADEVLRAMEVLRRYERMSATSHGKAIAVEEDVRTESVTERGSGRHPAADPLSGAGTNPSPLVVTPPPSLHVFDGSIDLGGFIFKGGVPFLHNDGGDDHRNTALGLNALVNATPGTPGATDGGDNTAVGFAALRANTAGRGNTAVGEIALLFNATGDRNTAIGSSALRGNITGESNTAVGTRSLDSNTTGRGNTAVGSSALAQNSTGNDNVAMGSGTLQANSTGSGNTAIGERAMNGSDFGSRNTAIGAFAGGFWGTGSSNVAIGDGASGEGSDDGVIRIGGFDCQTQTFIEGIFGATASGGIPVFINSDDQLGTATSSARFKQDIHDLRGVSEKLLDLRPVSFRYRNDVAEGGEAPVEYGLIAEEVAEVFPELVVDDAEGRPYTVRYQLLAPLLLGEFQRQEERLRRQDQLLAELQGEIAAWDRVVDELLQRLEAVAED
jgi:hypothetical protein